jgi:hypothetical protein
MSSGYIYNGDTSVNGVWVSVAIARYEFNSGTDIVHPDIPANYNKIYVSWGTRDATGSLTIRGLGFFIDYTWGTEPAASPFEGCGIEVVSGTSPESIIMTSDPTIAGFGGYLTFLGGRHWSMQFAKGVTGTKTAVWQVKVRTASGGGEPGSSIYIGPEITLTLTA